MQTPEIQPAGKPAAWKALEDHQRQMRDVSLRALFAGDPERGPRLTAEAAGVFLDYSKNRVTDETLKLLIKFAEECEPAGPHEAMFRRREDQHDGKSGGAARGAARAAGRHDRRRWRKRRARRACGARQDGGFARARAQRRMEGAHGKADQEHRQHRHRRVRSGAGDGV